ncbi:MAG: hypothetical protein GYA55_02885, partial [SAR324 cluster bacterium]|nr:hypothetical protein [SAR324 cluster bacterium]
PLQSQNVDKSLVQESILRELGAYREQELLQALKPGLQHIDRQEQRLLLLKDPVILSLLKEIRLIDPTQIAGNSHEEKQFLEFLKQMCKEVPMKESRTSNENFARRDLEEGLARLEQQFRSEQSRPIDPKALELRNLVSSIEQLMKGHEFLDRVNTLMNMLGEPALMLFPSLVHGFASQLELLSYPNPKHSEVEEDETGTSKHEKKQAYKRFEFDMNFEGIGRIQTRAFFRDGEFLLDLCVENNSIAEFVNQRLSKFEAFLHLQGYERTELHISVAPFSEITPSWVPMLLGAASNNETI